MTKKPIMSVQVKREGNRITTSIKIDPQLLNQAKHLAIDENITFSELLEKALKHLLEERDYDKR